jgi:arylsulfatase A-like enzyme
MNNRFLIKRVCFVCPYFWHYPHYSRGLGGRPSGAVRLGDFKLIEFYEDMNVELYDVRNDLGEKYDLSEKEQKKRGNLRNCFINGG